MGQPVKLSDALILDARVASEVQERSIAGQVEFWAHLGRSVEMLLDGRRVMALRRSAGVHALSHAMSTVDTAEGRRRLAEVLANKPYPHFEPCPDQPELLVRIEENGRRTVGRFVNRVFIEQAAGRQSSTAQRKSSALTRPVASRSAKGRRA